MATALGWILLIGGIAGAVWAMRARAAAAAAAGRADAPATPNRNQYIGMVAAVVIGLWLVVAGSAASGLPSTPSHAWDFAQDPGWLINKSAIQWDQPSGTLKMKLESGSGAYAVAPVDWDADAFRAEFDIQVTSLVTPLANISVGLFDGSISNIDDRDHVGGSTIQASFGNDIRLSVSDANLLSRTDSMAERENGQPIKLDTAKTYHAVLGYNRKLDTATLDVTEQGSSQPLVQLKVEELKDFTPNVAYFGVSIKGFNKSKDADPKPTAEGVLDNVRFYQP